MPLLSSNGDEFACNDEVKVYIDEGEEEEPKKISDNLNEDKQNLVIELEDHEHQSQSSEKKDNNNDLFKMPYYGHLAMAAAAAYAHNQSNRVSSPTNNSQPVLHQNFNFLQNPTKLSTYYPGLLPSSIAAAASLFKSNSTNPLASIIGNSVNPFASFTPSFLHSNSNDSDSRKSQLNDRINTSDNTKDKLCKKSPEAKSQDILHSELIKAANFYNLAKSPDKENNVKGSLVDLTNQPDSLFWPSSPIFFNNSGIKGSISDSTTSSCSSNQAFSTNNMLTQVAAAASARLISSLAAAAVACSESSHMSNSADSLPSRRNSSPNQNSNITTPNSSNAYAPYQVDANTPGQFSNGSLYSLSSSLKKSFPKHDSLFSGITSSESDRGQQISNHSYSNHSTQQLFEKKSKAFDSNNNNNHSGNMKPLSLISSNDYDQGRSKKENHVRSNGEVRKSSAQDERRPSKPHIKKPLNAFMLYMKEMRPKVQDECTLKESAAINQILGRKWHELPKDQQAKYYEMARKEKEIHSQMFPGWSARDNYAMHSKRKKRRKMLIEQKAIESNTSMSQQLGNNCQLNSNGSVSSLVNYQPTNLFSHSHNSNFSMMTKKHANELLLKDNQFSLNRPYANRFFTDNNNPQQHNSSSYQTFPSDLSTNHRQQHSPMMIFRNQGQHCSLTPQLQQTSEQAFQAEANKIFNDLSASFSNNSDGTEITLNSQSNSPLSSRENNSLSPSLIPVENMQPKKCRARYGLDQQEKWCKPCRRKKKCIRFYMDAGDAEEHSLRSEFNNEETMPTLGGTSLISNYAEETKRRRYHEPSSVPDLNSPYSNLFTIKKDPSNNSLSLLNGLQMNFKFLKSNFEDDKSIVKPYTQPLNDRANCDDDWPFKFKTNSFHDSFLNIQLDNRSSIGNETATGPLKPN